MPPLSSLSAGFGTQIWELPPLILHPFHERTVPSQLMERARAGLVLSGILPEEGASPQELTRQMLESRFLEVRMLYFLGKDLFRWVRQCVEWAEHIPELAGRGLGEQSFSALLVKNPPDGVEKKLAGWGVSCHAAIFSRALGLHSVFREPPGYDQLTEEFLTNYHRYADHFFACYQRLHPCPEIGSQNFHFELYASAEYARMLEDEWGTA